MSAIAKLWAKKVTEMMSDGMSKEDAFLRVPDRWRADVEGIITDTEAS